MPVSADIFTADFIRDVGATSVEQLLAEHGAAKSSSILPVHSTSPRSK
jgi:hypothetical protein